MRIIAILSLILGLLILAIYSILLITNGYLNINGTFSLDNASKIAPFIGSCVGVFFSFSGTLLIFENLSLTRENNNQNQLLTQKTQFESTYFSLLAQQIKIRDVISTVVFSHLEEKDLNTSGVNFFDDLCTNVVFKFNDGRQQSIRELIKLYNEQFTIHNSDIGHYFRYMYHIVKFVDSNPYFNLIRDNNNFLQKKDYIKFLRAQLSNPEITLLALNGLTTQGEKFKKYINDYDLLININFEFEMPEEYPRRVPGPDLLANEYMQLVNILNKQRIHNVTL